MDGGSFTQNFEVNGEATEVRGASQPQPAQATGVEEDNDVQIVSLSPAEAWDSTLKKNGAFKKIADATSPKRNAAASSRVFGEGQRLFNDGAAPRATQQPPPKPLRRPSIRDWRPKDIAAKQPVADDGSEVEFVQTSTAREVSSSSAPGRGSRRMARRPNEREPFHVLQRTKSVPLTRRQEMRKRSRPARSEDMGPEKSSSDVEIVLDVSKRPSKSSARSTESSRMERESRSNDCDQSREPSVSRVSPTPTRRQSARLRCKPLNPKLKLMDALMGGDDDDDDVEECTEEPVEKPKVSETIDLDEDEEPVHSPEEGSPEPLSDAAATKGGDLADSPSREVAASANPDHEVPEEPSYLLFHFPPVKRGSIAIMSEDLSRLKNQQYLNDSLIDFYCKFIELERKSQGTGKTMEEHSVFFFNSFFFHRLRQSKPVDYDGVKRWTNSVDLFSTQFIFVPMCVSSHWSLIIAANMQNLRLVIGLNVNEAVERAEEMGEDRPGLIYMDSLEPRRGGAFCKSMIEYIAAEWIHRRMDCPIKDEKERLELVSNLCEKLVKIIQVQKINVPIQSNDSDCGLYVLHNIALFLDESNGMRKAILRRGTMTKKDELLKESKKMRKWYTHADIHRLRRKIIGIICDLTQHAQEQAMKALPGDAGAVASADNDVTPVSNEAVVESPNAKCDEAEAGPDVDGNEVVVANQDETEIAAHVDLGEALNANVDETQSTPGPEFTEALSATLDVTEAVIAGENELNPIVTPDKGRIATMMVSAGPMTFGIDLNAALGQIPGGAENGENRAMNTPAKLNGVLFPPGNGAPSVSCSPAGPAIDLDGSHGTTNEEILDAGVIPKKDNSLPDFSTLPHPSIVEDAMDESVDMEVDHAQPHAMVDVTENDENQPMNL